LAARPSPRAAARRDDRLLGGHPTGRAVRGLRPGQPRAADCAGVRRAGAFSLADLSIRPAILADAPLGDAFAARHLAPLAQLGRLGAELEATLHTFLAQGMRIEETARGLHVHPNTLRHRLRRYEETTGASLRDPRVLVELWWALERRRLQH
jgi:DNA-binding PucR family transcriptional regulator